MKGKTNDKTELSGSRITPVQRAVGIVNDAYHMMHDSGDRSKEMFTREELKEYCRTHRGGEFNEQGFDMLLDEIEIYGFVIHYKNREDADRGRIMGYSFKLSSS